MNSMKRYSRYPSPANSNQNRLLANQTSVPSDKRDACSIPSHEPQYTMPLASTGSALIYNAVEWIQCSFNFEAVLGLIIVSAALKPLRVSPARNVGQSPAAA